MLYLHVSGSSNPIGTTGNADRTPFHPYFSFKDLVTVFLFFILFSGIIFFVPDKLGQLWPYFFIVYNFSVKILKYAVCWEYFIVFNQWIYYKTIFISYLILFLIIFIKNSQYLNLIFIYFEDLNTNIVKYYIKEYNQQVTKDISKNLYYQVGTSETLRVQKRNVNFNIQLKNTVSFNHNYNNDNEIQFNQWLGGLIDGDGCFMVSQKGYTSCEITVALKDEKMLRLIQNKVGGSIKLRSGVKAIRIRFQNKDVMINLVNRVNGFIFNSVRLPQLARVCDKLNILMKYPDYNSIPLPWFMGMIDADGTINYYPHYKNNVYYRNQLTISVFCKHYQDVIVFKNEFGGLIYFDKTGTGGFQWKINSKLEHLNFYDKFLLYPCKSVKSNRIFLIKQYYEFVSLKAFKSEPDSKIFSSWIKFIKKWNNRNS